METTVKYWINTELTPKIYAIANLCVKTKNGKLSEKTYAKLFENEFGNELRDAYNNLYLFYANNIGSDKYDVVEPTMDDARKFFAINQYFIKSLSKKFANERDISKDEINDILWGVLI